MTYLPDKLAAPALDLRDKPAFWMRGGQPSGPGSRATSSASFVHAAAKRTWR